MMCSMYLALFSRVGSVVPSLLTHSTMSASAMFSYTSASMML